MTVAEMKRRVMIQSGEDMEDMAEFEGRIVEYINDGYFQLMDKYMGGRYAPGGGLAIDAVAPLAADMDVPELPGHMHSAIADYATCMMYRNGNAARQSRGQMYLAAFNDAYMRMRTQEGEAALAEGMGRYRLKNLYS